MKSFFLAAIMFLTISLLLTGNILAAEQLSSKKPISLELYGKGGSYTSEILDLPDKVSEKTIGSLAGFHAGMLYRGVDQAAPNMLMFRLRFDLLDGFVNIQHSDTRETTKVAEDLRKEDLKRREIQLPQYPTGEMLIINPEGCVGFMVTPLPNLAPFLDIAPYSGLGYSYKSTTFQIKNMEASSADLRPSYLLADEINQAGDFTKVYSYYYIPVGLRTTASLWDFSIALDCTYRINSVGKYEEKLFDLNKNYENPVIYFPMKPGARIEIPVSYKFFDRFIPALSIWSEYDANDASKYSIAITRRHKEGTKLSLPASISILAGINLGLNFQF